MTGCAHLTSEGRCEAADGESGSLVSTLCCQPDSSRLSLSPSALFLTTTTGVWFVTSIWLQLSPLTLHSTTHAHAAAATRTHAHTHRATRARVRARSACGRGVFCYFTCLVAQPVFLGRFESRGLERKGTSPRKISTTRSNEDICPLKASAAV